jgi:hypothetical protein
MCGAELDTLLFGDIPARRLFSTQRISLPPADRAHTIHNRATDESKALKFATSAPGSWHFKIPPIALYTFEDFRTQSALRSFVQDIRMTLISGRINIAPSRLGPKTYASSGLRESAVSQDPTFARYPTRDASRGRNTEFQSFEFRSKLGHGSKANGRKSERSCRRYVHFAIVDE